MTVGRDLGYRNELALLTPSLRGFARALVEGHQVEAADELVQAALVQALGETQECRGTRLRLRMLSTLISVHRRTLRQARADRQTGMHKAAPHGAVQAGGWDAATRPVARDAAGLDDMPVEWREALLLIALERLTYVQTAECLGTTLNSVIANLARAREHLVRATAPSPALPRAAAHRPVPYLRVVK